MWKQRQMLDLGTTHPDVDLAVIDAEHGSGREHAMPPAHTARRDDEIALPRRIAPPRDPARTAIASNHGESLYRVVTAEHTSSERPRLVHDFQPNDAQGSLLSTRTSQSLLFWRRVP